MSKLQKLNQLLDVFLEKIFFVDAGWERTKPYKIAKQNLEIAFKKQLNGAIERGLVSNVNDKLGKVVEELEPVSESQKEQIKDGVDKSVSPLSDFLSISILLGLFMFVANRTGQKTLKQLGISAKFSLTNEPIIDYYVRRQDLIITSVDNTTKSFLANQITKGLNQGLSVGEMVKEIRSQYKDFTDYRAERIVRTETQKTAGDMSWRTAKYNGSEQKHSIIGGRACEDCIANDAEGWIPMNESFSSGDMTEPFHPNCMCTVLYQKPLANVSFWAGE